MDTTPEDPFDELLRQAEREERLARLSGRAAGRDAAASGTGAAARPSRRHAARGSRSAALGLSVISTLGLAGWLHQAAGATTSVDAGASDAIDVANLAPTTTAPASTSTTAAAASSTTARPSTTTTTNRTASSSALADGQYTGSSVSTRWGPVQVRITVSGGRITAVDVPSYPSNDNKSRSINASAVPRLVQSTLTAQSASVNSVSGATYTSNAYKSSLQSAIDQAKK